MIQVKREPSPKGNAFNVTITRVASGEKIRLFCETVEKRNAVEKQIVKLFKAEHDNIVIVDEKGAMKKMIEP